ncbi:MAG: nitrilase-related carbon-nitrogen hydrolase [Pseudomonadota bacterium]
MSEPLSHYRALALQSRCDAVNGLTIEAARERIHASIARIRGEIAASKAFIGPDLALVVLPEYFLSGFPMGEPLAAWSQLAALAPDGEEYEALGRIASDTKVHIAGNVYETDPHFPGLYFQASFIIAPNGNVVLRYRRLLSMFAPSPWDVWDLYLEHYGLDGVFPVADTDLGRLAAIASEEILYPELARTFAMRGAEVFLHSTSEVGSPALTPKDIAKRARAFENNCWLVSANSAAIVGTPIPANSTDGMSKIVDHQGVVLAEAGYGETMVAHAEIDLAASRRWRRRPGMQNMLARQRPALFAETYSDDAGRNALLDASGRVIVPERSHFVEAQRARIQSLTDSGVI